MAKAVRVRLRGKRSWTVLGSDALPVVPAAEYLASLEAQDRSPNTIESYARGLAEWWTVLELTSTDWADFPLARFGDLLVYLRSGDLPGVSRIGPAQQRLAESTVAVRAAAVIAFYRFMASARNLPGPAQRLAGAAARGPRSHSRYIAFLDGIAGPRPASDRPFRVRPVHRSRPPVLSPDQIRMILNGCATRLGGGWSPGLAGLRDRLLFAVLAETGMRLGEALSLRHCDVHPTGAGASRLDVVPRRDHPHGVRQKSPDMRTISIGSELVDLYSDYVWELVDAGIDVDVPELPRHFVFVNVSGSPRWAPLRPESVYGRVRAVKKRCPDLPADWSPHWFRHSHATGLLLAGVQPHIVKDRLGHRDIQTTMSIYGWVTAEAELEALQSWRSFVGSWEGLS